MKLLRHDQPGFAAALEAAIAASSLFDPQIDERVRAIIADVQARGDAALLDLTARFDGVRLTAAQLRVTGPVPRVSVALRRALAASRQNIAAFAQRSLRRNWEMRNRQGGRVGEKFDPIRRVGIYVPGGSAPLVSTVLMTVTLAKIAGCREIVVCTPPGRDGAINPDLHYALRAAGATEIYRVGGAQAIAALALGTATVRRVAKIFGPGNAYVVAAKRLLFGRAAMDLLPGPSEVLIIADDRAEPRFIAADLLAQAEHGSGEERVWLVTTSDRVWNATQAEIELLLAGDRVGPTRRAAARKSLEKYGVAVVVRNLAQAVDIANRFAPEHLEIMTKQPRRLAAKITTAGAIFLGRWSPTVVGDYVAGPSHVLPTGGAGAALPGLTVDQFQRRTSVIEFSRAALAKSLPALETFAKVEGLDAHAASAGLRLDSKGR